MFSLLFFDGLGNYYFLRDVYEKETQSLANFLSFYILIFIPFHSLFRIDFTKFQKSEIHQKTYDGKYSYFNMDYERANPMTRIEGEMRYLDKL